MTSAPELSDLLERTAASGPLPIAAACKRHLTDPPADLWQEWEQLSRQILTPALQYLSHLLLSDLVATGRQPAHLFHRIQSVLSRPLGGHYVGFLRETTRFYRDEGLECGVPQLVDLVLRADIDCTLLESGKPLLGLLVDYRNLWAHGRFDNPAALEETVTTIRELTAHLLAEILFLERYPLELEDGTRLMGSDTSAIPGKAMPLVVISAGDVGLRPLLVKLKGQDLVLLEDFDLSGRMAYRGSHTSARYSKAQVKRGDGAAIFEELKTLLEQVRAIDAVLPSADWSTFSERSSVVTDRVLSLYEEMRKYVPGWYVPRPGWHGEGGVFHRFMASEAGLLALSGVQGTGKSALVSHLAQETREQGSAVFFINAQRFTLADVQWSGNPYPEYLAKLLHYQRPFDRGGFRKLIRSAPEGRKVVLFIDAINEVDGIEVKWNRFRAMELLLEWIAEVSQPGLKVVLSFRLDAYEEYEYLQPDDVPDRIAEIAFADTPHRNPRKPWVVDLQPFDDRQAQALYEKLRNEPEHGMAPAMSWDEVRDGLGEHASEFIANPLLFMIFLRSHHREATVHTSDRDELFQHYADRLTGATERQAWPWWRKAWGFLKNGNITAKERLLADLVSRMSEEGSAALTVEHVLAGRSARDKRLAQALNARSTELQDLEEGGLLALEVIETAEAAPSRRLSFVAELMVPAMEAINSRTSLWARVRQHMMVDTLAAFSLVIVTAMLKRLTAPTMIARGVAQGLTPAGAMQVHDEVFENLQTTVVPVLVILFVCLSLLLAFAERPFPIRRLGLFGAGYLHRRKRSSNQFTHRLALCVLLPVVIWVVAGVALDLKSGGADMAGAMLLLTPLIACILVLLGLPLIPRVQRLASRMEEPLCSARIARQAHGRQLTLLSPSNLAAWRRRVDRASVTSFALCGAMAVGLRLWPHTLKATPPVWDSPSLLLAQRLQSTRANPVPFSSRTFLSASYFSGWRRFCSAR